MKQLQAYLKTFHGGQFTSQSINAFIKERKRAMRGGGLFSRSKSVSSDDTIHDVLRKHFTLFHEFSRKNYFDENVDAWKLAMKAIETGSKADYDKLNMFVKSGGVNLGYELIDGNINDSNIGEVVDQLCHNMSSQLSSFFQWLKKGRKNSK